MNTSNIKIEQYPLGEGMKEFSFHNQYEKYEKRTILIYNGYLFFIQIRNTSTMFFFFSFYLFIINLNYSSVKDTLYKLLALVIMLINSDACF